MNGFLIILLLTASAFLPVFLALLWFRHKDFHFPLSFFLIFLAGGVLALILALCFQILIPSLAEISSVSFRAAEVFDVFIRIAMSEEGAKFIVLLIFFRIGFFNKNIINSGAGAAAGLLAGLSFAALEGAVYAASDPPNLIIRMVSSVPLHGACAIRLGLAAFIISRRKTVPSVPEIGEEPMNAGTGKAALYFLSAVILHSLYDFILPRGGVLFSALALCLSLSALLSSAQRIQKT